MLGLGTVHLNSILVDCNLVVEGGGDAVEAEAWVDRGAEAGGRWVVVDGCNDGNPDGVPDGTPDGMPDAVSLDLLNGSSLGSDIGPSDVQHPHWGIRWC